MNGTERMKKTTILIDTDFGDDTDDAAAFRLALSCGCLDIAAVTTVFGDTEKRAEMVLEFLSLYGKDDIPVAAGHGKALIERDHNAGPEPIQYPVLKNRPKASYQYAGGRFNPSVCQRQS